MNEERIRKEGIKLIEEFSKMLEKIPDTEETHYVLDLKNVTRKDQKPVRKKEFSERMRKIAPMWEEGYVIAEKGLD